MTAAISAESDSFMKMLFLVEILFFLDKLKILMFLDGLKVLLRYPAFPANWLLSRSKISRRPENDLETLIHNAVCTHNAVKALKSYGSR